MDVTRNKQDFLINVVLVLHYIIASSQVVASPDRDGMNQIFFQARCNQEEIWPRRA